MNIVAENKSNYMFMLEGVRHMATLVAMAAFVIYLFV